MSGLIVYRFAPEAEGPGTDELIRAFHQGRGLVRPRVPLVKGIATVITLATGGSAGPESSWVTGQSFAIEGGNELRKAPDMSAMVEQIYGAEVFAKVLAGEDPLTE